MRSRLARLGGVVLAVIGAFSGSARAHAQTTTDAAADVEVILSIDASESMEPALDAAKSAANDFVDAMPDGVRIGVESFADEVEVVILPTADRDAVGAAIDSIETDGDTALYDAVVAARQHFTPETGNKVLVLLSDGMDEGSVATLDDAVAATDGVRVEAISLTTPQTDLAGLGALGPVTSADDPAAMSAAFVRVADLLVEVVNDPPPTTSTTTTTTTTTTTVPPPSTTVAPATTEAPETTVPVSVAPEVTTPPAPAAVVPTADAAPQARWLWLGAGAVFAGLLLLGLLVFPRDRVSKSRLGSDKPRTVSDMGVRTTTAIEEALERSGRRADLGQALAVADISTAPAEFVAWVGVVAVVAGSVGLLVGGPLLAVAVAVAVCLAVWGHVNRSKRLRQAAFADQLADVLQLLTTALRSGYGITQAMESVAEEAEEPARTEFAHVLAEVRLGRDLSESLHALADRMESPDLEWVVSAIDINRETGGNLSEILDRVGVTIRERGRVARQVRTLTAEGRLSARILTALPAVMLLWQWRVNPENFSLLTRGAGLVALVAAGILLFLGATWVRKIVKSVAL